MSSPLPGAIGESDPPSFFIDGGSTIVAAPSSLPTLGRPSLSISDNGHGPSSRSNARDLELHSLPSCK